jgi:glycerol kinase
MNDNNKDIYRQYCGLPINTYFTAVKMRWLLDNVPQVQSANESGNLCFGTIDSWLIFKLTKGVSYATDSSNASRTMLMNINTLEWD